MLHRTDAADADTVVDHAHNDYLEMLVEGGLAQFVPGVLAIVLVFRLGLRAVEPPRGRAGRRAGAGGPGGLRHRRHPQLQRLLAAHSVLHGARGRPRRAPVRPGEWKSGSGPGLAASAGRRWPGIGPASGSGGWPRPWGPARAGPGPRDRATRAGGRIGSGRSRARPPSSDRSGDPARLDRKVALLEGPPAWSRRMPASRPSVASAHLNVFEQQMSS